MLFVSFLLIGCAWAAMLALPFTILTNALSGGHMGTYLGLFNGTICIPQIVAAALGGSILALFTPEGMLPPEINMLVTAGVMLIIVNPEKPDVPLNKNDAFQKVQKRHVQEKR